MGTTDTDTGDRSPLPVSTSVVVAAVVIPLVLLVVVLVLVRDVREDAADAAASEPVTAVTLPSPGAGSAECAALVGGLPDSAPVVVRCGLDAPPGFTVGTTLQEVNGVQWFNEPDPDPAVTASTWVAVDRPEYVAVTLPDGSGTGPIQDLSDALTATLDLVEPRPAPIG